MSGTKSSILCNADAAGGALEGFPVDILHKTEFSTYFNDFQSKDGANAGIGGAFPASDWDLAQMETGTAQGSVVSGGAHTENGILFLDCPGANQGPILQFDSSASAASAAVGHLSNPSTSTLRPKKTVFATKISAPDISEVGFFIGMHTWTGEIMQSAGSGALTDTNYIGVHHLSTDNGAIRCIAEGNTAGQSSVQPGLVLGDAEWLSIICRMEGANRASIYLKKDGAAQSWTKALDTQLATNWSGQLCITMAMFGSGVGKDLYVDYVLCSTSREYLR